MTEEQLIKKLFKYGDVEVFKMGNDSLTLFMTGNELNNATTSFAIIGAAEVFCPRPSKIHVMKTSCIWLLLILKF